MRKHLIALCMLLAWAPQVYAQEASKEYFVKAAFIYNFLKFIEWPAARPLGGQVHICMVGDNPFGKATSVFDQASTAARKLSVEEEKSWRGDPQGRCHIMFIGRSLQSDVGALIGDMKSAPVLTISEIDGFADKGGMIEFTTQDNKVKLVVNKKAVQAAGLKADSQLLEIALRVIN